MEKFKKELFEIVDKEERATSIIKLVEQIQEEYKSIVCDFIMYNFMKEIELSEKTIENYTRDIKLFLEWYGGKALKEFSRIDSKRYRNYLKDGYKYKGKAIGIKSINTKIVAVNQLFKYLDGELEYRIGMRISQYKIEQQNFTNELITNDHIIRMLRQAKKQDDNKAIAIFYALFYTGARVSEMLQLKITDIDKDFIMVKGKGNKYRELLVSEKLKVQLKEYLQYRKQPVKEEDREYLFTSKDGVIARQTVHKIIKNYCGKARGIKKEIAHAHAFRHRYAKNLIDMGINETVIAQLLGHSLTVTGIYTQNDRKELLKIINRLSLEDVKY